MFLRSCPVSDQHTSDQHTSPPPLMLSFWLSLFFVARARLFRTQIDEDIAQSSQPPHQTSDIESSTSGGKTLVVALIAASKQRWRWQGIGFFPQIEGLPLLLMQQQCIDTAFRPTNPSNNQAPITTSPIPLLHPIPPHHPPAA